MSNYPLHHLQQSIAAKLILSIAVLFFFVGRLAKVQLLPPAADDQPSP